MRYRVVRHLDKIQLHVCGGHAFLVHRRLLTSLKSADWCRFKRHRRELRHGYPIDIFICPGTAVSFRLTLYRDSFFTVQLSDPSVDVQRKLLDALEVARVAYGSVSVSLFLCEFALDFYPEHGCDLYDLSDVLFSSVFPRRSRTSACGYADGDDNRATQYQGNKGYVRCRWVDEKYVSCGKGLRCYMKNNRFVRIELQCNKPFLKRKRLGVCDLPLYPETVNVLDYVEFRRKLDDPSLSHLINVMCKKRRPNYAHWSKSRQNTFRDATEGAIQGQFSDAMVRLIGAKVGASDKTGEYPEYSFRHDELHVALQISVFKELKKEYGFTSQINEFFYVNKRLTEDVKRGLKKTYRRTVLSKG